MNKKSRLHIVLFLLFLIIGIESNYGQREPQYTQYMYNIGSFNPAYAATVENFEIVGAYRDQFIGFPGAPRIIRFGLNIPLANDKNGLGFNVVNDAIGPSSQTFFDVAYSFQIKLSEVTKLSFGIDAGGSILNVDFSEGSFENPNEPLLGSQMINSFFPVVGAGVFLYGDTGYLGLSVPNFLTSDLYNDEVATIVEDQIQFNFIGGYVFDLGENLKFKPAFLVNYVDGLPLNLDLSANFLFGNVFTAGASYRLDNAVSGLAGFQISPGTFIGYSYDYSTNNLSDFNNGSHEVILKFYVGKGGAKNKEKSTRNTKGKPKQIDTPRFF